MNKKEQARCEELAENHKQMLMGVWNIKEDDTIPIVKDFKSGYQAGISDGKESAKGLVEAAQSFQDLNACYRIGKNPNESLFKRLDKAKQTLKDWRGE